MKITMVQHYYWMVLVMAILGVVLQTACVSDEVGIEGVWERFDQAGSGAVVTVQRNGVTYEGTLLEVAGLPGFKAKDLKWRQISSEKDNSYQGEDLYRAVNTQKGDVIAFQRYDRAKFVLMSNDIMHVTIIDTKGNDTTIQKWRRLHS